MRYLGIDYGSKRVGIAISDEDGILAFPYNIIPNNLELIDCVHNICGKEEVSAIVLGESHDLSGKPNKIMGSIEELKRNLEAELDIPVYFQKEFMTTIEARGRSGKEINNAKKTSKIKQTQVDASAAALILSTSQRDVFYRIALMVWIVVNTNVFQYKLIANEYKKKNNFIFFPTNPSYE